MKTTLAPIHRMKFPPSDGEYLTPFGWWLARLMFRARRCIPFVTMRRYLIVKLERDRMIHELHMMAIKLNQLEREAKEGR